jgi:hypothetical protein
MIDANNTQWPRYLVRPLSQLPSLNSNRPKKACYEALSSVQRLPWVALPLKNGSIDTIVCVWIGRCLYMDDTLHHWGSSICCWVVYWLRVWDFFYGTEPRYMKLARHSTGTRISFDFILMRTTHGPTSGLGSPTGFIQVYSENHGSPEYASIGLAHGTNIA